MNINILMQMYTIHTSPINYKFTDYAWEKIILLDFLFLSPLTPLSIFFYIEALLRSRMFTWKYFKDVQHVVKPFIWFFNECCMYVEFLTPNCSRFFVGFWKMNHFFGIDWQIEMFSFFERKKKDSTYFFVLIFLFLLFLKWMNASSVCYGMSWKISKEYWHKFCGILIEMLS